MRRITGVQICLHPYPVTGHEVWNTRHRQGRPGAGHFDFDSGSGKIERSRVSVGRNGHHEDKSGRNPRPEHYRMHWGIFAIVVVDHVTRNHPLAFVLF